MEVADRGIARTTLRREPGGVRRFCLAILGTAIGIGCVLAAAGASFPAPGPVFLLALAVALCINRFALFPSEQAATAEAAVLLAAVVGFRHDAVFLGPLAVAVAERPCLSDDSAGEQDRLPVSWRAL